MGENDDGGTLLTLALLEVMVVEVFMLAEEDMIQSRLGVKRCR